MRTALLVISLLCVSVLSLAQTPWERLSKAPSTLHLEQGIDTYRTPEFIINLVRSSQTVAALHPASDRAFDFTPGDSLKVRSSNGLYHLGDLNIRLKQPGDTAWKSFSTAAARKPIKAIKAGGAVLAAADLTETFASGLPLQVQRFWEVKNNQLVLRFVLHNPTKQAIEIGALGMPMIFNNLIERRTLEQAHVQNVFYDPYIGGQAGYLQVTRLNGHAPSLLVLPQANTSFEAYNPLLDDPTPRGIVFEGFYEWMALSKAYAEKEWKQADPWNRPTSILLKPGETRSYGVQLVLSGTPRDIETTLRKNNRPVAVGIPGYVLPSDVKGKLFLEYKSPVQQIDIEPKGALTIEKTTAADKSLQAYAVNGKLFGRSRLTITYQDGMQQVIHYKVINPERKTIEAFGDFLTTKQWYDNSNDPFHRAPGIITYDYEKQQQVDQDNRAWIAGLSDEGGAGGWLGAMMKQLVLPNKNEIAKLERFVDETLLGRIQVKEGPQQYGVRKSLFYYEPDSMPKGTYSSAINFKTWSAWPLKEANNLGRAYNYPHVAAAYWVLYRMARNHKELVTNHNSDWYLEHAYHTITGMMEQAPYYTQFGLMEGSVFYFILKDLKAEGKTALADKLEALMKKRAIQWNKLEFPFGSEMPWDSTGQEEVYIWCLFFGYEDKAAVTLNAILGYMPTLPSWAYNGNARRYWDFLYGGKTQRIERMIHHYGSELNAIPVLTEYRRKPDDLYLLRVGYGGVLGGISNITEDGFAPCAFHAFPATLKNDGINGDYGSGFYGYAINTATYITNDKKLGWLAFGGNVSEAADWITVDITTAAQRNIFIAPVSLWISFDAGQVKTIAYNKRTKEIKLTLAPADAYAPTAYFRLESTTASGIAYKLEANHSLEQGRFALPLADAITTVVLRAK